MPNKTSCEIKKIIESALLLVLSKGPEEVVEKLSSEYIPLLTGSFKKSTSPLLQYADSALANGNSTTEEFLEQLRPIMSILPWEYSYDERSDAPGLSARIGWAELVGPKAPFKSDKFCLGFTLIAPDTLYPEHNHPATELYYVLSGTANWTLDGKKASKKPGSVILHPSLHKHSMETKKETLLALYIWTGDDIVTLSEYT